MTPEEIRKMPVDFGGSNYRDYYEMCYLQEIAAQLAEIKELCKSLILVDPSFVQNLFAERTEAFTDKQQEEEGNEPPD